VAEGSERFANLLDLQEHDTAIGQLLHRRANLAERAELATVDSALRALAVRRSGVDENREVLASRQSTLEEQIGASKARSQEIQRRLYGGTVTAGRELQAMDEEVRHLGRYVTELEDRELEVMEELEPIDAELSVIDSEVDVLNSKAAELRGAIAGHETEIDADLVRQRAERARVAEVVPTDLVTRYEQLRTRLGGTGAARLVGGSCGGCHLQLPAVELDRLKRADPDTVIFCDQCGRILVR
jgi:predicted  nucleic acid-binding Zn-ribbon protein